MVDHNLSALLGDGLDVDEWKSVELLLERQQLRLDPLLGKAEEGLELQVLGRSILRKLNDLHSERGADLRVEATQLLCQSRDLRRGSTQLALQTHNGGS